MKLVTITIFLTRHEYRVYLRLDEHDLLVALMSPYRISVALDAEPAISKVSALTSLSSTQIGDIRELTFDGLAIVLGSAILRCGVDPSGLRLIVQNQNALPASIGRSQIMAIAAMLGVPEFHFACTPIEPPLDNWPLSPSQHLLVMGRGGFNLLTLKGELAANSKTLMGQIDEAVRLLRIALIHTVQETIEKYWRAEKPPVHLKLSASQLATIAADRLIDIGDFSAKFVIDSGAHIGDIPVCVADCERCQNAIDQLISAIHAYAAAYPLTVACLDEAYIGGFLDEIEIVSILETANYPATREPDKSPNWSLGLRFDENFRGASSLSEHFDMNTRILTLNDSQTRQEAPILIPPSIVSKDSMIICINTEQGETTGRIPISSIISSERMVACYAKSIRRQKYAEIFDFYSTVTETQRLIYCFKNNELVVVPHGSIAHELSTGFLAI
ncbi:MAG: hypothetical protein GYB33_09655 [Gammaproteobacteria bacterium]|nr:hypothetical protein [Gammaproteobacteria bacterium]